MLSDRSWTAGGCGRSHPEGGDVPAKAVKAEPLPMPRPAIPWLLAPPAAWPEDDGPVIPDKDSYMCRNLAKPYLAPPLIVQDDQGEIRQSF